MANFKTPPSRNFVRESRPHDYVYDQIYTTSKRDFYKDVAIGSRAGASIKLHPVFPTMFSALKRDQRLVSSLKMPQPNHLDNFLPQYNIQGMPVFPMDTGAPFDKEVEVTGADRAKFIMKYTPQTYYMDKRTFEFTKLSPEDRRKQQSQQRRVPKGTYLSRGVQTDYRESETQTDPYSPAYTLPYPSAYPKVLALIKLTWGKGLPATLEDIVVIERALTRRLLEYASKDLEDDTDFEKRIRIMEELEAQQWVDREKDLTKILEQKMEITSKLLSDLASKIANDHTMRLERLHEMKKDENDKYLDFVKNNYLRELRKLENKYFEPKKQFKRDIIQDYTKFDSHQYAPCARNGPNLDMLYKVPEFQFDVHRDYQNFRFLTEQPSFIKNELEFDVHKFAASVKKLEPPGAVTRMERKLEETFNAFRAETAARKKLDDAALLRNLMQITDDRDTQEAAPVDDMRDESEKKAAIVLQKIARGRSVQKMLREELNQNMPTLLGMKSIYDMDPYGMRIGQSSFLQMMNLRQEREENLSTDAGVSELVDHLEGETLATMLDFLDKEMVRLLDERKIHALLKLADRERRMREAAEAGRRQHEEEHRRTNDEIFRQVVGIHQSSVDLYLEDMYLEAINRGAAAASRQYVQRLAATLNEASYAMHNGEYEQEEVAAELVSCFLMPELHRLYNQHNVNIIESRYQKAAEQVTDAVFSAQDVVKSYFENLITEVTDNVNEANAAVDGSQAVTDAIILKAVSVSMDYKRDELLKQQEAKELKMQEIQQQKDDDAMLEFHKKKKGVRIGEADSTTSLTDLTDKLKTKRKLKSEKLHSALVNKGSSISGLELHPSASSITAVPDDESNVEISAAIDALTAEREAKLLAPAELAPNLKPQLAAKAIMIKYNSEISEPIAAIFDGACETVRDLFEETKKKLIPISDEEYSDHELDSDDDSH